MKKQGKIKWLLIAELIVLYFSILNLVGHIRGPARYAVDESTALLDTDAMTPFFDMGASAQGSGLLITNTVPGQAVGYSGKISLQGLDGVAVSFSIDCPAQCAGNEFIVDLYNYEANYDDPQQDYRFNLSEGLQELSFQIAVGEKAPESCQIRLFTSGIADYTVENLAVYPVYARPKVTTAMVAVPVVMLAIFAGTGVYCIYVRKK